jgi:hypothetical protein
MHVSAYAHKNKQRAAVSGPRNSALKVYPFLKRIRLKNEKTILMNVMKGAYHVSVIKRN